MKNSKKKKKKKKRKIQFYVLYKNLYNTIAQPDKISTRIGDVGFSLPVLIFHANV